MLKEWIHIINVCRFTGFTCYNLVWFLWWNFVCVEMLCGCVILVNYFHYFSWNISSFEQRFIYPVHFHYISILLVSGMYLMHLDNYRNQLCSHVRMGLVTLVDSYNYYEPRNFILMLNRCLSSVFFLLDQSS